MDGIPKNLKTSAVEVSVVVFWQRVSFLLLDYLTSFAFAETDIFPSVTLS